VARPFLRYPVSDPIFPPQVPVLVSGPASEYPVLFTVNAWLCEMQVVSN
jgi:hypothetical protein